MEPSDRIAVRTTGFSMEGTWLGASGMGCTFALIEDPPIAEVWVPFFYVP